MTSSTLRLLGRGLYSPTEASRLTRVPIRRINRWTRGYNYTEKGKAMWSEPIVGNGTDWIGDAPFLVFADLMEIRCLSTLRDKRVAWKTIRLASMAGKGLLKTEYPFSSERFKLVGRQLLADVVDDAGDRKLIDLVRDQIVFDRLVLEELRRGVHYENGADAPSYWSPLGKERAVILHPKRSFGAPIVTPAGVPTRVLYNTYRAEDSYDAVANWYNVPVDAVHDAVEFEVSIRAAA